jgi:hypothetical protein
VWTKGGFRPGAGLERGGDDMRAIVSRQLIPRSVGTEVCHILQHSILVEAVQFDGDRLAVTFIPDIFVKALNEGAGLTALDLQILLPCPS